MGGPNGAYGQGLGYLFVIAGLAMIFSRFCFSSPSRARARAGEPDRIHGQESRVTGALSFPFSQAGRIFRSRVGWRDRDPRRR